VGIVRIELSQFLRLLLLSVLQLYGLVYCQRKLILILFMSL